MMRSSASLRLQMALVVVLSLLLVWATAFYELYRSHQAELHDAEVRTAVQAQVFAEYSRSTIKRINEVILSLRTRWGGDWKSFAAHVSAAQENIDDVTFQVAVIDRDGLLAFSNLAAPSDRTDLSQREHFRVHKEAPEADRLFVSRPLLGKVSGKWSIQVTRPIVRDGRFDGVVVISVSPDQFAGFAEKLGVTGNSTMTVIRNTGEIMARYPATKSALGQVVKDRPFQEEGALPSGNYRRHATVDGIERIFGYFRLPEYGMTFVIGEPVDDILRPFVSHRRAVLAGAVAISLLALLLFFTLSRSLRDLEEVRRQLDAIFSLSPDGFVSFDTAQRVKYVSPAFLKMCGLAEASVAGLDEAGFEALFSRLCVPTAPFPGLATLRAGQVVSAPEGRSLPVRHLVELAGPGNRVLEVGIRLGDSVGVSQVLYFRDVTHETEVDRMKSEFLSTAAHELRTPMASIYGYTELMLAEDFPAEERKEMLEIVYRQSGLMISIINELLDLVRIEERRGKDFDLVRVDAATLLREAAANFKAPPGRAAPELELPESARWLRVDRKKLAQVVGNVLSNAYKYSPEGGSVRLQLVEAPADQPGRLGIRIRDAGIGMAPEELARVCERFFRADTSGKIPGTGLGMSIVEEIVELHGGSVDIVSRPGEGTQVTLWLPLAEED